MTARDFCYWLQGYFEVAGIKPDTGCTLTNPQVAAIQRHLSMVFAHDIDPKAGGADMQEMLSHLHNQPTGVVVRC